MLAPADHPADRPTLESGPTIVAPGEIAYSWDIGSDHLRWGANAGSLFDALQGSIADSGIAYARYIDTSESPSRYDAVFGTDERDHGGGVSFTTHYALRRSGRTIWIEDHGRWFAGPDGRPSRVQGALIVREGSPRAANGNARGTAMLRVGRTALLDALGAIIDASPHRDTALVLVAAADLAFIRQTYGHAVAEEMIGALIDRLRAAVRADDALVRWPENGCGIILRGCGPVEAAIVAERLIAAAAREPVQTNAGAFETPVRIGAVASTAAHRDPAVLVHNAEDALDAAQTAADGRFVVATAADARREAKRREARAATQTILQSLDASRVSLKFQPIVWAKTRKVAFYEGLTRMTAADGSMVSPGAIFPVAEQSGLVRRIDRRALDLAVGHLMTHPERTVSVNVSPLSAHDPAWKERLTNLVTAHPEAATRLIVEITESAAIGDLAATRALIADLQRFGVRVAMDDFGAGHSSFRNLRDLRFDLLKLDGAFVKDLTASPDDACFARTLIELANHLRIPIVAEWVEDEETARILEQWGADYFQGFLFGKAE